MSGWGVVVFVLSHHFKYEGGEVVAVYADEDSAKMAAYAKEEEKAEGLTWVEREPGLLEADVRTPWSRGWWEIKKMNVLP